MAGLSPPEITIVTPTTGIKKMPKFELARPSTEVQKQNYHVVKDGFLNIDKKGASRIETAVCGEAFVQLWQQCGNPTRWTDGDMMRPEIHDLVMGYRTFGRLSDDQPLIPDEVAVLHKLLDNQQAINSKKSQLLSSQADLKNAKNTRSVTKEIELNQTQVNAIRQALASGIPTEAVRYAVGLSGPRAVWAKPGEDMDAEFTAGIVHLYDLLLRTTDAENAETKRLTDFYQNEPVRPNMTEEEKARALLAMQQALAQAMLMEQKRAEEAAKKRLEEQMDDRLAA